ncbi:MAG: TetR/AcrR family transcriptional regulator [SAR86 cluster bacterium]|tara:strand:+ start:316 stop:975 length:660 start_codon:yes stop_codon:yes gene_type:complete
MEHSKDSKLPYHHGALRQALLEAGDSVLRDRGLSGFTLRECARRAGVSHAAPKHHFGDVRGFLTEIAALGFDQLTRQLQTQIAIAHDLDEEFINTTRAYADFAGENPEHFRIMFRYDLLSATSERLAQAAGETFTVLTNVVLRQRGDPELLASVYDEKVAESVIDDIVLSWSHIHGFAHLKLEQQMSMLPAATHDDVMVRASRRLSRFIRSDAGHQDEG